MISVVSKRLPVLGMVTSVVSRYHCLGEFAREKFSDFAGELERGSFSGLVGEFVRERSSVSFVIFDVSKTRGQKRGLMALFFA